MRLTRRLTFIAALLIGALLPSAASAATLYITEYANIGAIGSNTTPWPPGQSLATQQVAVGGGSLQSSAFGAQTKAIQVICDVGCSVSVGSSPTAATTSTLLQQGVYQNFVVVPGQKIAVIANTAGNTAAGGGGATNATIVSPLDVNNNVKMTLFDGSGNALTYNANGQATAANSSPVVGATGTIAGGATGTAGTAASNVVTVQGIASMTPVQVSQATASNLNATVVGTGTFAVQAQPTPVTSGGLSWYFVQPAASDNHIVIKAGAGQVYHIAATNNSATVNYIRLYNATTGFNGCNSATNIVGQWAVPASTSGAGLVADIDSGIAFSTGISICVTSGYATTDTTNATASAMSVNVGYK